MSEMVFSRGKCHGDRCRVTTDIRIVVSVAPHLYGNRSITTSLCMTPNYMSGFKGEGKGVMNFAPASSRRGRLAPLEYKDPAGGTYNAPSDPLAGGEEASFPIPKNPTPPSAFWASGFGPSGLTPDQK